jgi:tRNA-(ms[2]io[6]A)-hydroxylase
MNLVSATPTEWVELCLSDFDSFLSDHAACERKASATGLMFAVRYPDKHELVEAMIQHSREELMHFHQVWRLMRKRGLSLRPDEKTPYVNQMLKLIRNGREHDLLDRLLVIGIVEMRGHERFLMMGQRHPDQDLRDFYSSLAQAEERHFDLFERMALLYHPEEVVRSRLEELLLAESKIISTVPLRPAVH